MWMKSQLTRTWFPPTNLNKTKSPSLAVTTLGYRWPSEHSQFGASDTYSISSATLADEDGEVVREDRGEGGSGEESDGRGELHIWEWRKK